MQGTPDTYHKEARHLGVNIVQSSQIVNSWWLVDVSCQGPDTSPASFPLPVEDGRVFSLDHVL